MKLTIDSTEMRQRSAALRAVKRAAIRSSNRVATVETPHGTLTACSFPVAVRRADDGFQEGVRCSIMLNGYAISQSDWISGKRIHAINHAIAIAQVKA